ncbi:hypothetical protein [Variovorax sp. GB1P17]|uniref:hypothetical protein n=1 Tax=Variovorax sp. GB1P17 TaxID=3443740 RepID=UPI003F47CBF1
MPLTHTARSRHIGGFTLIEIVITVLITVLIASIDLRFVRVGNTFRWEGGTPRLIVGTDKGDKRTLDIGAGGIALRLLNWREVPVVD